MTERGQLRDAIVAALQDPLGRKQRIDTCTAVASGLSAAGRTLWVGSYVLKDKPAEGVAVLTEMSAELAVGAVSLFSQQLWYAGGSLVRQLIEAEYLFWLFAQEEAAAEGWLDSTPEMIRRSFRPAALRRRSAGAFRDSEYWTHCELGGHPNPKGRLLLREHSSPIGSHDWLWVDLIQHLDRLWLYFRQCLLRHNLVAYVDAGVLSSTDAALEAWSRIEAESVRHLEISPEERRGPTKG